MDRFGWTEEYIDSHPVAWRKSKLKLLQNEQYIQKFWNFKTMKDIQKAGLTMGEYQEWRKKLESWGITVPQLG